MSGSPKRRSDLRQLARLWTFVAPQRGKFGLALLILLLSFGIELLGPYLVRRAIDGPISAATDGATGGQAEILWLGLAYLGCALAGTALGYGFALLTAKAGREVVLALRTALHGHLLRLDPRWHDRHPTGQLVTRVTTDVENLEQLVSTGLLQSFFDLLKVGGIAVVLFLIDWRLALYTAAALPIAIVVSFAFRRVARRSYAAVRGRLAEQNAFLGELIGGLRTIRAFNREAEVDRRFDKFNGATRAAWCRTVTCYALFFATVDLALRWTQGGLLLVGGLQVLSGAITAGVVVQFWLYLAKTIRPVRELGERYHVLQAALASLDRLTAIFDELPAPVDLPEAEAPPRGPGELRFEAVSFGYSAELPVLRGVELHVPAGCTCAIVGPTGAGKSTLLALAGRSFDPDLGRIRLDGLPLPLLPLRSLRRRIAFLPQEPYLFGSAGIIDNVRLFDQDIDPERVRAALDQLGILDRLEAREGGLDAPVGERGARLSAGERQLITFARALLADPQVLLLDEPTASIDSRTEQRVQLALRSLLEGRSCLIVAHRLSTVRHADRIVVLERGRIVEQGSHDQLLARGGTYAEMLRTIT